MKPKGEQKTISGGSTVVDFPVSDDGKLKFLYLDFTGQYPDSGLAFNVNQTEGLYLTEGELKIEVDGKTEIFIAGDVVYFQENQKYKIKGTAKGMVAIAKGENGRVEKTNK